MMEFPNTPYTLGAWLGDGYANQHGKSLVNIVTQDREIPITCYLQTDFIKDRILNAELGASGKIRFYIKYLNWGWNRYLLNLFKPYKRDMIPYISTLSREESLDFLAGILDTDGSYESTTWRYVSIHGNYIRNPFWSQIPILTNILGMDMTKPSIGIDNNGIDYVHYNIHINSFIKSGGYFRVLRKMNNVQQYAISNQMEIPMPLPTPYDKTFKLMMKNTDRYIPILKALK